MPEPIFKLCPDCDGAYGEEWDMCPVCYPASKELICKICGRSESGYSVHGGHCTSCPWMSTEYKEKRANVAKARARALELNSGTQERLDFGGTDRIELKPDGSEFWGAGIKYKITYSVYSPEAYKVAELKPPKPLLFPKASWINGDEVSTVDKTGKPGYTEYNPKPGTHPIAGLHYDVITADDLEPSETQKKALSDAIKLSKFYTKYNAEKSGNYADPSLIKADKDVDDPPPVKTPCSNQAVAEA